MQESQQNIITFRPNGGRTGNLIFPYMLCKLIEIKLGNKYVPYSMEWEREEYIFLTDENKDIEFENLPKNKNIILNLVVLLSKARLELLLA